LRGARMLLANKGEKMGTGTERALERKRVFFSKKQAPLLEGNTITGKIGGTLPRKKKGAAPPRKRSSDRSKCTIRCAPERKKKVPNGYLAGGSGGLNSSFWGRERGTLPG